MADPRLGIDDRLQSPVLREGDGNAVASSVGAINGKRPMYNAFLQHSLQRRSEVCRLTSSRRRNARSSHGGGRAGDHQGARIRIGRRAATVDHGSENKVRHDYQHPPHDPLPRGTRSDVNVSQLRPQVNVDSVEPMPAPPTARAARIWPSRSRRHRGGRSTRRPLRLAG